MTREEAYKAMTEGKKITHTYFSREEYYYLEDGKIRSEDEYDHSTIFYEDDSSGWRKDGWEIWEEPS